MTLLLCQQTNRKPTRLASIYYSHGINRVISFLVQRMEEGRLPKEVMKWRPPGRRKRGRPKLTWAEGIRGLMGEKRLMEEDWNYRGNWRKKIL